MSDPTHALRSPYTPGYNQVPTVLAGRDEILAAADEAVQRAALDGRTPPALVLVGPRGMGKSVLLTEVASLAERFGWLALAVDTPERGQLAAVSAHSAAELYRAVSEQQPSRQGLRLNEAVMKAGLAGVGGELRFARPRHEADSTPTLPLQFVVRDAFAPLIDFATKGSTGLVLTIDEAQNGPPEDLQALAAWHQYAVTNNLPVVFALAGLPALRAKGVRSAFERADWFDVGPLPAQDTLRAVAEPASTVGRPYDPGAAEVLASQTGGYPYAVQVYGHAAWRASVNEPTISTAAVQRAVPAATAQLERNLYSQRWQHSTPKEREYLVALAQQVIGHGPTTGGAVAGRLGTTAKRLSVVRDRLIGKGTLLVDGQVLSFVVPGLAAYVIRRAEQAQPLRYEQPDSALPLGPLGRPDAGAHAGRARGDLLSSGG